MNSCPDDVEDMDIVQSYIADNETAKQCIETCLGNTVGYRSACDENVEGVTDTGEPANVVTSTDMDVQYGPETNQARYNRLGEKLKVSFAKLTEPNEDYNLYDQNFLKKNRVIVDVDLLLSLFNYGCQYQSCMGKSEVSNYKFEAGCCNIQWKCSNGHTGTWASSSLLCNKGGKDIYAISTLLAIFYFDHWK